jgi:hypothetical protein
LAFSQLLFPRFEKRFVQLKKPKIAIGGGVNCRKIIDRIQVALYNFVVFA